MPFRLMKVTAATIAGILLTPIASHAADFSFKKHTINADSKFETCGVGDINRDGRLDVMCGDTWYEATGDPAAPWKPHHVCDIKEQDGYYHDFANELEDVNGDGRLDVVSCTWHTQEVLWREQPASLDQEWKTHIVDKPGNMEVGFHVDVNGDGLPDFHPHIRALVAYYERLPKPINGAYWKRRDVGKWDGLGGGTGDMDGDGDIDFVVGTGWFENPGSDTATWPFHADFTLGTNISDPLIVHDFTGDGLVEIVWGNAHDYGLFWLEQSRDADGKKTWTRHTIDKSWSQPHFLALADLNSDGVMEIVTGKRYHAHNGKDPGGNDELVCYIYPWNPSKKTFDPPHVLDRGGRVGFGLRSVIKDLDGDGDLDITCPGKSGLYWFENLMR